MELELLPQVRYDIHGTEPLNKIIGEKHKILAEKCPWVIFNGAPYFAEASLVTVYDQRGAEMVLGRDYFFEGEFPPLVQATGRRVCSFIKLSDAILNDNAFVTADYQTVGAYFVPRTYLEGWLELIRLGQGSLDWSLVVGVPPSLPACYHSHSIKTEIGDWFELTFFYTYLEKIIRSKDLTTADDLTGVLDEIYGKLVETKESRLALLEAHDKNYAAPHGTNKFDVLLGNHPNFKTATPAQELAGVSTDVLSTPKGVSELAKTYEFDTDGAMLQGVMPISSYGGESFIPPNISGSFEGLGGEFGATAFCLESSGSLMMLSNHFDGRQEGLYYSFVEDYDLPSAKIVYTGFKYEPPSLVAIGINPITVVGGSNGSVLMVGIPGTNDWFLTLPNGTYDSAAHQFVKVDMTEVNKLYLAGTYNNHAKGTVHSIGSYLVLIQNFGNTYTDSYGFFRVSIDDVRKKIPVKWEPFNISYKDWDGTQYTNVDRMVPYALIRDANNKISKLGPWTFRQPATSLNRGGRSMIVSCPKPGAKNVAYMQFVIPYTAAYSKPGLIINVVLQAGTGYELNAATGVMTQINKVPALSVGFTDSTNEEKQAYREECLNQFYNATNQTTQATTVILESGVLVTGTASGGNIFPVLVEMVKYKGRNNPADVLKNRMDLKGGELEYRYHVEPILLSPILSGTYPCSLTYEPDGELYGAIDQKTNNRKVYLRLVTGDYQVRPGIDNLSLPNILSRPLTNQIYTTNINHNDGIVAVTGDASELTKGGVECGSSSFSMGGYSSFGNGGHNFPKNASLKAPASSNVLVSFPRTVTRTLDRGNRTATYKADTFYGFQQNLVDRFKEFIPAEFANTKYWCFSLNMLGSEMGGMFKGLNFGIAVVHFIDAAANTTRSQIITFTAILEAPNTDHPEIYLINDIVVLDAPAHVRAAVNVKMLDVNFALATTTNQKPILTAYRESNNLKVYFCSPYSTVTTSTIYTKQLLCFDVALTTKKVSNIYGGGVSWSATDVGAMFPKVGLMDINLNGTYPDRTGITAATGRFDDTGGAASIYRKTMPDGSVRNYLGASAYPETGWVVFFQEAVQVTINGTIYNMPGGSIDLRDIDVSPQNKVFYVYATIEDDKPKYIFSTVKLRKSGTMLLAAILTTNDKQVLSIERLQPVAIAGYQLSYTREGGTIPISTGLPQDPGTFVFLNQGELLP